MDVIYYYVLQYRIIYIFSFQLQNYKLKNRLSYSGTVRCRVYNINNIFAFYQQYHNSRDLCVVTMCIIPSSPCITLT